MVPKLILDYINLLSENNNRDWFHANKAIYQEAKSAFEITTLKFISMVNEIDPGIGALEPKDCIFRIFRDVRFSNDKSPYKTNFGAYVNKGGKKSAFAGYYLHIQPGSSFVASGIHMPDAKVLNAVRNEILHYSDEFKSIINHPPTKKMFGDIHGEKLKMAPKGFDKSFKDIELLKFKSFNLFKYLSDDEITDPNFATKLREMIVLMSPFNQFFNRVIADLF